MLAMMELRNEMLAEAKQGMQTPEGAESLKDGDITDIANVICASIVGGAWAAMDEWGTGSLMDTSNPALSNYKNGPLWNPVRRDNKIRTRPRGAYTNIFGDQVVSTVTGGIDLEELGVYSPTPPSHAIQTAARWMKNGRIQRKVSDTVRAFPFGRFFVVDKK